MKLPRHLVLLLLLLLAPFVYAMFFTFPAEDDYCRANSALYLFDVVTGLTSIVSAWLHSSGRYVHHFLVVFLADAVEWRVGYAAACLGVLAVYGAALRGILRQIAGTVDRATIWFLTLGGLATLLASNGTLPTSYYFVTDALGVGLGDGMALVCVWALCRLWYAPELTRSVRITPFVAAVLTIGCYEHAAIAALIATASAAWMAREARHPYRGVFWQVLGVTTVFFLISFLAPGNFARLHGTGGTMASLLEKFAACPESWLASAPRVFATPYPVYAVLLGLVLAPIRQRPGLRPIARYKKGLAALCCYLAVVTMVVVLHAAGNLYIGVGSKLLESLVLLCGYVLVFAVVACVPMERLRPDWLSPSMVALFFCVLLALTSNTKTATANMLNGSLRHAARVLDRREIVLRGAKGRDVRVAPLASLPFPSLNRQSFEPAPRDWSCIQVTRHYRLRSAAMVPADAQQAFTEAFVARAPQWQEIQGSSLAFALATEVQAGINRTYVQDWLFIRVGQDQALPPRLEVAWTQDPQLGALPVVARAIRDALLTGPTWRRSWLTDCATQRRDYALGAAQSFTVDRGGVTERIVALPLRGQDGTALVDAGVSFDGTVFHRIR